MGKWRKINFMNFSKGQSILGVILAMAIFALMASSIAKTSIGNINALNQGGSQSRADALAQEAVEAVRAIKDGAWNDLYSSTTISFADYSWSFDITNVETIGDYTRTVEFADVCRDGSDIITACPGTTTDLQSKKVTVTVAWEVRPGLNNSVVKEFYLTNWDSREWTQTDWSSGPGQSVLTDTAGYDSDDGGVDYSTAGEIKIMEMAGQVASCMNTGWSFTTSTDYIYDNAQIEVADGTAHLTETGTAEINGLGDAFLASDITNGYTYNTPTNLFGSVYAVAYYEYVSPYPGRLKIYSMDELGNIQASSILNLQANQPSNAKIKHVYGDVYAVFYSGQYINGSGVSNYSVGFIETFSVDSLGNAVLISSSMYNGEIPNSYFNDVQQMSPGLFGVFFTGDLTAGTGLTYANLKMFNIDNSGNITDTGKYLQYGGGAGYSFGNQKIFQRSASRYLIFYSQYNTTNWISTSYSKIIDVDSLGNITQPFDASEMVGITDVYGLSQKNDNIFYAYSYTGGVAGGENGSVIIKTISVDNNNNVSNIDTLSALTDYTYPYPQSVTNISGDNYLMLVGGTLYDVNWNNLGAGAYMNSFSIDNNGNISNDFLDSYQYSSGNLGYAGSILNIGQNLYVLNYTGSASISDYNYKGYLVTFIFDSAGNINLTGNSLNYLDGSSYSSSLVHTSGDFYTIFYADNNTQQGVFDLVTIVSDGTISAILDTFVFSGSSMSIINGSLVSTNKYLNFVYTTYSGGYQFTVASLSYTYYGQLYTDQVQTISSAQPLQFTETGVLKDFTEAATKGTNGQIYYQLSNDDGNSWLFWDGITWSTSTLSTDYNLATDVDTHIAEFPTSTRFMSFKAFLVGEGYENISLDSLGVNCKEELSEDYTNSSDYSYNSEKIEFSGGQVGLKTGLSTFNYVWTFDDYAKYYYDPLYIDVSGGKASMVYYTPTDTFTYDYTTSTNYVYNNSLVEFESSEAKLKNIGAPIGDLPTTYIQNQSVGSSYYAPNSQSITNIRDNIYLVAYSYATGNGGAYFHLKTRSISDTGVIGTSDLSYYNLGQIYSASSKYKSFEDFDIVKLSDGYFAVIYTAYSPTYSYIKTFSVSATGVISQVNSHLFYSSIIYGGRIIKLDGSTDKYAITFSLWYVYVYTYTISEQGIINTSLIDSFSYREGGSTVYNSHKDMIYISDNIYAISYDYINYSNTSDNHGSVITLEIENTGNIVSTTKLDSKTYGNNCYKSYDYGRHTRMVKISDNHFALVHPDKYCGFGDNTSYRSGLLKTYSITDEGILTQKQDTSFASGAAFSPSIYSIGNDTYLITGDQINSYGKLYTYHISQEGILQYPLIDSYQFTNYYGLMPDVVQVKDNIFAIASDYSSNYMGYTYLATFNINTIGTYSTEKPSVQSSLWVDSSVDTWDGFTETASKNGGEIYYQLSNNGTDWYYWDSVSSTWSLATTSTESNTASVLNTNISSFTTTTNSIAVKAFLSSDSTQKVALNNIDIPITRTVSGYSIQFPGINPTSTQSLYIPNINSWRGLSANVNTDYPGDVYYQLSDDDGDTWQYWNGSAWEVINDINDYNSINVVNDHISNFSTSTGKFTFKALLKSDSVKQVEVEDVTLAYAPEAEDEHTTNLWHFNETSGDLVDSVGGFRITPTVPPGIYGSVGKFDNSFGNNAGYNVVIASNIPAPDLANNFTIDMWIKEHRIYFNSAYQTNWVFRGQGSYGSYNLRMDSYAGDMPMFHFYRPNDGATYYAWSSVPMPLDVWNHLAITYDGHYLRMFQNGVMTVQNPFTITVGIHDSLMSFFTTSYNSNMNAYQIDELRFSNVARWTSNFTPPSVPFAAGTSYDSTNPSVTSVSNKSHSASAFTSFEEVANKDGGQIYYQLSDNGSTWKYWNGTSWSTAGSTNYNTADIVNNNIASFSTTTGQISVKAILSSDGTQHVQLDDLKIFYDSGSEGGAGGSGAGSGGGFATSTYFISSAFDMGDASPAQYLEWDEDLTACTDCSIKIQVSTAPDNGGVPGTWTPWYGVTGADTYFVDYFGSIIPNYLNGRRFVRYRVELLGDGTSTPVFKEMRINYK